MRTAGELTADNNQDKQTGERPASCRGIEERSGVVPAQESTRCCLADEPDRVSKCRASINSSPPAVNLPPTHQFLELLKSEPSARPERGQSQGCPARQLFVEVPWFEEEGRLGRKRAAREQVEGEVDWALQGLTGFDFQRERGGTGVLRLSSAIYGPV